MPAIPIRPVLAACTLGALALLVSACLLSPGRFTSALDIRKDGRFAFSYTGEIHLLALSKLADLAADDGKTFNAQPCYAENSGAEKPCDAEETAAQRREWEEERKRTAEKRRRDAESMKSFLGGIDPRESPSS